MTKIDEYTAMFRRNLPFIVRSDQEIHQILQEPTLTFLEKRDESQRLIGLSVLHKNTIYLLCVEREYRCLGLGSSLLRASEAHILEAGYTTVIVGAGDSYFMPGIPTRKKPYDEPLAEDALYPELDDTACAFFQKRGYYHSWKQSNCFDMRAELASTSFPKASVGDRIDGVLYRWASRNDLPQICACTRAACDEFTTYYLDEQLYEAGGCEHVLIAEVGAEVAGTLLVSLETDAKGLGSVGCTTVSPAYRGRHIGVNMVLLGTKYLKEQGLQHGYLGYTYSGLDKMYGYAGYRICVYYFMAEKKLS